MRHILILRLYFFFAEEVYGSINFCDKVDLWVRSDQAQWCTHSCCIHIYVYDGYAMWCWWRFVSRSICARACIVPAGRLQRRPCDAGQNKRLWSMQPNSSLQKGRGDKPLAEIEHATWMIMRGGHFIVWSCVHTRACAWTGRPSASSTHRSLSLQIGSRLYINLSLQGHHIVLYMAFKNNNKNKIFIITRSIRSQISQTYELNFDLYNLKQK